MTNSEIKNKIKKLSEKFESEAIELRRSMHQNPELSFEEFHTSDLIYRKLNDIGLDKVERLSKTGVVGLLQNKGKCVALRADIDALPITEDTKLHYSSKIPGKMHACGHDIHSAILYGAGLILSEIKNELKGSVKFIFQPGEEKNPGGASLLIKEGVLKDPKPDVIFGQHIMSNEPAGNLGFYPGIMMASQDELYITITGKPGHGAKPHTTIDPIVTAAQVILGIQTIVSRNADPYEPFVITIGKIEGGSATNIIPEEVKLSGTIRAKNDKLRKTGLKRIEEVLKGITSASGAKYKFKISPGYPELSNDPVQTNFARNAAIEFIGKDRVFEAERFMGAEDFAYYLKNIPGTFYRIGIGKTTDIHTSTIKADESVIKQGSAFMAYLTWKYLNS